MTMILIVRLYLKEGSIVVNDVILKTDISHISTPRQGCLEMHGQTPSTRFEWIVRTMLAQSDNIFIDMYIFQASTNFTAQGNAHACSEGIVLNGNV